MTTRTPENQGSREEAGHHALVTGGSGFIGSHLVEHLLAQGDRVTVVDDLSTGRADNLASVAGHARLRVITGDCAKTLDAFGERERFDEVYHLAAAVGVKLVVEKPIECIETNVVQTAAVLRFALTCAPGGGPAKTLIASSSEVYGKSEAVPFAEEDDVTYGPTSKARWSYAASKAIDEYLALAHHQQRGLPAVVVRFFNTVGPRQIGDYGMVLPSFVRAALAGEPLHVYGDGTQARCFCDVRDSAQALPRLLRTPSAHGRVFNLGSDRPITIRALADLVVRTLGSASRIDTIPYDRAYAAGFEDLRRREPDLTRIRAAIGFSSSIPLERTITDIAHAMKHTTDAGQGSRRTPGPAIAKGAGS